MLIDFVGPQHGGIGFLLDHNLVSWLRLWACGKQRFGAGAGGEANSEIHGLAL